MKNKIIFFLMAIISMMVSILAEQCKLRPNDYEKRIKAMKLFFPPLIPDSAEHAKIKEKDRAALATVGFFLFCPSCPPELLEAEKPLEKRNSVEKTNQEKWYNKITRNDVANFGINVGIILLSFIPGILICSGIEHLKAHYHFFPPAPQPEGSIPDQSVA